MFNGNIPRSVLPGTEQTVTVYRSCTVKYLTEHSVDNRKKSVCFGNRRRGIRKCFPDYRSFFASGNLYDHIALWTASVCSESGTDIPGKNQGIFAYEIFQEILQMFLWKFQRFFRCIAVGFFFIGNGYDFSHGDWQVKTGGKGQSAFDAINFRIIFWGMIPGDIGSEECKKRIEKALREFFSQRLFLLSYT